MAVVWVFVAGYLAYDQWGVTAAVLVMGTQHLLCAIWERLAQTAEYMRLVESRRGREAAPMQAAGGDGSLAPPQESAGSRAQLPSLWEGARARMGSPRP